MAFNWAEMLNTIKPLLFYILGMSVYCIFVFMFYKFISRKELFELDLSKHNQSKLVALRKSFSVLYYVIEHVIVLPLIAFLWFLVIGGMLSLLSKNDTVDHILLVSAAVVATIRITAYYNEELSDEVAKILPFALLGIYLVEIRYFSWSTSLATFEQFILLWQTLLYYLLFIVVLEIILRVPYSFKKSKDTD